MNQMRTEVGLLLTLAFRLGETDTECVDELKKDTPHLLSWRTDQLLPADRVTFRRDIVEFSMPILLLSGLT